MKLRKYGKTRPVFKAASISLKETNQAANHFMTTYELLEMTISRLSAFELAQMQRVCKYFRDLINTSNQIRQAIRRESWLPPIDDKDPSEYQSAVPSNCLLNFDSGLQSHPDVCYFRIKSISYNPAFTEGPDVIGLEAQHALEPEEDLPRSEIRGKHQTASAKLWRVLRLCPDGILVNVIFNSKYKGWQTARNFGAESTLGDVYGWLVDVRDRRLQMGMHRTVN